MMEEKMVEEWRDVIGYEGLYRVSNKGKVISTKSGKEKSILSDKRGYQRVALWKNCVGRKFRVHRLVCFSFLPNQNNEPYVNHKDGDPSNNNLENLEWISHGDNIKHAYSALGKTGVNKGKFGIKNHRSKAVLMIDDEGKVVHRYECVRDAARDGGFDNGAISMCCNGKYKSHKGFVWEFAKNNEAK